MGAMTDKIKGKLKKAEGRITGDRARTAQGHVEEKKGGIKGAVKRGVRRVKGETARAKSRVRRGKGKVKRKASAARRMP